MQKAEKMSIIILSLMISESHSQSNFTCIPSPFSFFMCWCEHAENKGN